MRTGRPCTVCNHEDLDDIDLMIARGDGERVVARTFSLSKSAVHRHKAHMNKRYEVLSVAETPIHPPKPVRIQLDELRHSHELRKSALAQFIEEDTKRLLEQADYEDAY